MTVAVQQFTGKVEKYRRGWSALLNATHDFASLERPSSTEIGRFKELFYTLCLKGNDQELRIIANTLAFNPYVPRSIAYLLSLCRPQIAEQILLFSPVLKSRDLIAIMDKAGIEHAKLIAKRSDINLDVVRTVLAHDDRDEKIRSILKENAGLRADTKIQTELFSPKPSDRVKTDNRVELKSEINLAAEPTRELLELAGKGGKLGRESSKPEDTGHTHAESDGAKLLQYAREQQGEAFAWRIERRCKLPVTFTLGLIGKKDTGGLAALLRALEVPKVLAARILLLLTPALGRNTDVFNQVLTMYGKLNVEECRSFLRTEGADFTAGWRMTTDRMRQIRSDAIRQTDGANVPMPAPAAEKILATPLQELTG